MKRDPPVWHLLVSGAALLLLPPLLVTGVAMYSCALVGVPLEPAGRSAVAFASLLASACSSIYFIISVLPDTFRDWRRQARDEAERRRYKEP